MKKKLKNKNLGVKELNFKFGETFLRMNYLMKLSEKVQSNLPNLSRVYSYMIKDISKRNAIRIDSKVKKLICQGCNNNIFTDKNSHMEMVNNSGKHSVIITCHNCSNKCDIILF